MASNRFDTSQNQEYVSQYVPMPFEAMYKVGAGMQAKHEKALSDIEVTDPIAKLNPRAAIKVYDPNSPEGVSDAPLDWTSQKEDALKVLNAEKHKITDEYMQSGDVETFKRKSRDYINKAAQIHGDLSAKEAVAKQVNDFNKELAKNKDFAKQGHLGQKLLDYNTQFFKDAAEGNVREYAPYDVAATTDRPKEVKEYFGSMGKEVLQSFSDPTNTGYIRTKYREGLTGNKISKAFNSWYQNSDVQDDIRLEALDYAARKGIKTDEKVKVQVPVSKDPKTGKITYKEEEMPWIDAYEERALNQVKDMALGFTSSTGKDALSTDATYRWKVDKAEDEENAQRALLGKPLESKTFDLTKNDPDFKDLKNLGIYKTNADGTMSVDLNKVMSTEKQYTDSQGNITSSAVDSEGLQNQEIQGGSTKNFEKLKNHLIKVAKGINYKGKVTKDSFSEIINKYNAYSKVRVHDEQMSKPVSQIESEKATRNINNYDFLDLENPDKPLQERPTLGKNDELVLNTWEHTADGNMNRGGYIKHTDSNGETTITPVNVRPKTIIDDSYHNQMSARALKAANYEIGNTKPIRKVQLGKTSGDLILEDRVPGVGLVEGIGYYDPNAINPDGSKGKKTVMYLFTDEKTGKSIIKPTQAELDQLLHARYYGTEEGWADTHEISTKKTNYEDVQPIKN